MGQQNSSYYLERSIIPPEERNTTEDYTVTFIAENGLDKSKLHEFSGDLLIKIFLYFDVTTVCRLARVCHRFNAVTMQEGLWYSILFRDMGTRPTKSKSYRETYKIFYQQKISQPASTNNEQSVTRSRISRKSFRISNSSSKTSKSDTKHSKCCMGSKKHSHNPTNSESESAIQVVNHNNPPQVRESFLAKGAKLCFLGDAGVGKSSILLRYISGTFRDYVEPTIGAAFATKTHILSDSRTVKFELWDTAGTERYKSLAPMYYRNALCTLIIYDITSYKTYERAKVWLSEVISQNSNSSSPPIPVIILVGCKTDLASSRQVDRSEAEKYVQENHWAYAECSAKTGENVNQVFDLVANLLWEKSGPNK